MRGLIAGILIFLMLSMPSHASLFKKKDYKKIFLNSARMAEKRNDEKSAFHLYEKTLFYYANDIEVLESYAAFCDKNHYFDKSAQLYKRLYELTLDNKYLFKKNLATIRRYNLSKDNLENLAKDKKLSEKQRKALYYQLINQYAYDKDWLRTKKMCSSIARNEINKNVVSACIMASEKTYDLKSAYFYYQISSNLYPQDVEILKKVLEYSEKFSDKKAQEVYLIKFSLLNPKDKGIRYRLAGFYVQNSQYAKANKIYESLIASGDKSDYVLKSYEYSKKLQSGKLKPIDAVKKMPDEKHTKKQKTTVEKVVSLPYKKVYTKEDFLYKALSVKDFQKAAQYLDEILVRNPESLKMIKLRADVAAALDDYNNAIIYLEKYIYNPKGVSTLDDKKILAYYYSQIKDFERALAVIKTELEANLDDKELLDLAIEYSMAQKKWDEALVYVNKALEKEPESEKLLAMQGDLYAINQDYSKAAEIYQKLVNLSGSDEYKKVLADLYQATRNYDAAEDIIVPLYNSRPNDEGVVLAYSKVLLARDKSYDAYYMLKKQGLENTKEGLRAQGDIAILEKDFEKAHGFYKSALLIDTEDDFIRTKLAESLRAKKRYSESEKIYTEILERNPDFVDAKIGLGYLEIDKEHYKTARMMFNNILEQTPSSKEAKMGVVFSYLANNDNMKALEALNQLPRTDETNYLRATILYKLKMFSDAKNALRYVMTQNAQDMTNQINKDTAFSVTPSYTIFEQQLSDEYDLDLFRPGISMQESFGKNMRAFFDYYISVYASGNFGGNHLLNTVNEPRFGVFGRPSEKIEYRADAGVKAYQDHGAMVNTDSWFKYYFNDAFALKTGFLRNNVEQSYLAAVGFPINGVFTGRAAMNKVYSEFDGKLPKKFYYYGRFASGAVTAQNLPTNCFMEGLLGFGKVVYDNQENPWIQTISLDLMTYNLSYQQDLLDIPGPNSKTFGGYFSPSYYTAEALNFKLEGKIKKWHLKYGLSGFVGGQVIFAPVEPAPIFGILPYVSYELNDYVSVNVSYNFTNYADIQRHLGMVSINIRGFKHDKRLGRKRK